jgi:hypothetical protein
MKWFLSLLLVVAVVPIASAQQGGVTNVRILPNGGFLPDLKVDLGPSPYDFWGASSRFTPSAGYSGAEDNPYYVPRSLPNPQWVINPYVRQMSPTYPIPRNRNGLIFNPYVQPK